MACDRTRRGGAQRRRRRPVAADRQADHRSRWCCGCARTPSTRRRSWHPMSQRRCTTPSSGTARYCGPPQRGSRSSNVSGAGCASPAGNAQELYFPVCFELAVTKGAPAQQDRDVAAAVLRDIHADRDRTDDRSAQPAPVRPAGSRRAVGAARPQLARRTGRQGDHRPVHGGPDHRSRPRGQPHRRGGAPASLVGADRRRHAVQPRREGAQSGVGAAVVDRRTRPEFR